VSAEDLRDGQGRVGRIRIRKDTDQNQRASEVEKLLDRDRLGVDKKFGMKCELEGRIQTSAQTGRILLIHNK